MTKINVNMQNETEWLSLEQMADLLQRDKSTISRYIKNMFNEGELVRQSTVAKFATVQMGVIGRLRGLLNRGRGLGSQGYRPDGKGFEENFSANVRFLSKKHKVHA
ncbi:hypothetical protein [Kineothrix sp. MB12-C1]|uniref:hypothetical protein n=1 Tax=Kineothrix sp. MB12-C1 TaxID=3070215 RepID=UPI0027D23E2D|nr:hypothetical protein [Kineothrix sp. MB12-C1]WMC94560.1 hypothetical protein RBB56_02015 [Kineothrix sp. MB12-C1]